MFTIINTCNYTHHKIFSIKWMSTCYIVQLVSSEHLDCFLATKLALKELVLMSVTLQKTAKKKTTGHFISK